eukprot:2010361-Prymnesium_polylepis.2
MPGNADQRWHSTAARGTKCLAIVAAAVPIGDAIMNPPHAPPGPPTPSPPRARESERAPCKREECERCATVRMEDSW